MVDIDARIIDTGENPDAVVIWLHGLGADGNDFVPIAEDLGLPNDLQVKFIFPHAPKIPVTINGGYVMPAWYDVLETGLDRRVDTKQLESSAAMVAEIIDHQIISGIDSKRIIVAGFSQGGAVSYEAVLSYDKPLGGLLAMSTYFATHETITRHNANVGVPVLIQHGTVDSIVNVSLGEKARDSLETMGYGVTYKSYPMDHSVCAEQVADISMWLQDIL